MVCKIEIGEIELKILNMKSRGNDEKVKVVGPGKSVRLREKTGGPKDICKLQKKKHIIPSISLSLTYFLCNQKHHI